MSDPAPAVQARDVHYAYPGPDGSIPVLRGVSLDVGPAERVAVVGPSGGGKSTLLNLLAGIEAPDRGAISVGGTEVHNLTGSHLERFRQEKVALIFQFFNLFPTLTAEENVLIAIEAMERPPADGGERAQHYLNEVGLGDKLHRFPGQLSGGEQQRVAIARALVREAPMILADEPTGNLDEDTADRIIDLLLDTAKRAGSALLYITHDLDMASRADRVLELRRGLLHPLSSDPGPAAPRPEVLM